MKEHRSFVTEALIAVSYSAGNLGFFQTAHVLALLGNPAGGSKDNAACVGIHTHTHVGIGT